MTPLAHVDERATALGARRYDRIAGIYDALEGLMELRARRWRRELWSRVEDGRILELGVGTGKNLAFYPPGREIVAMDISPNVLARARRRAERKGIAVRLELGDVVGSHVARDTLANVHAAGFVDVEVEDLFLDIVKDIRARAPRQEA